MSTKITNILVRDIRFPTSATLAGSDAMNPDPDYSATYVTLETDSPRGLKGNGLAFTNGRGNEICVAAVRALEHHLVGHTLESLAEDFGGFWNRITSDSQVRWLGPEKGVIHLATAALVNAVWDLYAKAESKPLWKLLVDMTPAEIVSCIPFRHTPRMNYGPNQHARALTTSRSYRLGVVLPDLPDDVKAGLPDCPKKLTDGRISYYPASDQNPQKNS